MDSIIGSILAKYPVVLSTLGSLVVIGHVYVSMTPSKSDDAWYAKLESMPIVGDLLKLLLKFSPISRIEKK